MNASSEDYIHPDGISWIDGNPDYMTSLEESARASTQLIDSQIERQDTVLKEAKSLIQHSRKERSAFTQEKRKLTTLHKTRSWKVVFKPLKKQ